MVEVLSSSFLQILQGLRRIQLVQWEMKSIGHGVRGVAVLLERRDSLRYCELAFKHWLDSLILRFATLPLCRAPPFAVPFSFALLALSDRFPFIVPPPTGEKGTKKEVGVENEEGCGGGAADRNREESRDAEEYFLCPFWLRVLLLLLPSSSSRPSSNMTCRCRRTTGALTSCRSTSPVSEEEVDAEGGEGIGEGRSK